jgi:hypothetical protein
VGHPEEIRAASAIGINCAMIHLYEVRPRKDRRGFGLISDVLPFGRPTDRIGYIKLATSLRLEIHCSRGFSARRVVIPSLPARVSQYPSTPEGALGKATKHDHAVVYAVEAAVVPTGSRYWWVPRRR